MSPPMTKSKQNNTTQAALVCLSFAALTPPAVEKSETGLSVLQELRTPSTAVTLTTEETAPELLSNSTLPDIPSEASLHTATKEIPNVISQSTDNAPENAQSSMLSQTKKATLGMLGVVLGGLGYINYFTRSVPPEKRSQHVLSRLGEKMFPGEPFFPGNSVSLRIFTLNHGVLLGAGLYAGIQAGQSLSVMSASLAAPAIFAVGSALSYGVSRLYGRAEKVGTFLKSCEVVAWASLVPMVAARFEAGAAFFQELGLDGVVVGISAGLVARTLSIAPMMYDFVKAAHKADPESFPPLRNQVFWLGATATGVAALSSPLGMASIVPIGYFLQNLTLCSIGVASKRYWQYQCTLRAESL